MFQYLWIFVCATLLSTGLTLVVKSVAQRFGIIDVPDTAPERKLHQQAVPLLGGVAVYLAFALMALWLSPNLTEGYLLFKHLVGILLAGLVITVGGVLDDRYNLSPKTQLVFPFISTLIVVASGIGISYITNPFGGIIQLDQWQFTLFSWNQLPYHVTLLADLFTIIWLFSTMYTTKLLDGLDGLVPGITAIGGVIIFLVSNSQDVAQPETGTLALILAGSALGFLFWNFSPAKIYLGESGSVFTGFMLGVLAILSGGKIATALLILGLPVIDLIWVVVRRMFIEKKSPFSADTLHLHFQLRQLGWTSSSIVLLFYAITIIFGTSTLFVQGKAKVLVLGILFAASAAGLTWLFFATKYNKNKL